MKFLDNHLKNVFYSIVSFLVTFYIVKFASLTVDTGSWIIAILLLLIYFELWDMSGKRK